MVQIAGNLWVKSVNLSVLGIPLGARATVYRLLSGELLIYSPIIFDPEDLQKLKDLGPVKYIIAPNGFHHQFVNVCVQHFPQAQLWASAKLQKKHPEWSGAHWLSSSQPFPEEEVQLLSIEGHGAGEYVMYLPQAKSLVIADLFFNLVLPGRPILASLLSWIGMHNQLRSSPLWNKLIFDRELYKHSLDKLQTLEFEKILLCHGRLILQNGKAEFQKALARSL